MSSETKELINLLLSTPLQILLPALLIIGIGYYFIKIAPKRFEEYKESVNQNNKHVEVIAKMCGQYEKALENSTRVVENNTIALKGTETVLKLTAERVEMNTEKIDKLAQQLDRLDEDVSNTQITLAQIVGKID